MEIGQAGKWVNNAYKEMVFWNSQNLFEPPRCNATKYMIKLMTNLLNDFIYDTPQAQFALTALMILPHLFLQRPHKHSTTKENISSIKSRVELWKNGELQKLLMEATMRRNNQKMHHAAQMTEEEKAKRFGKLMMTGKVNAALRMLSDETSGGVLPITRETRKMLRDKHPKAKKSVDYTRLVGPSAPPDPCLFESITDRMVWKKAVKTQGGAGPSGLNAKHWRTILSKKKFGDVATDLGKTIANLIRKLATKQCSNIDALTARRLIPLDKKPGVRPIGIGETLMRIVGKCIMEIVKDDVKKSSR